MMNKADSMNSQEATSTESPWLRRGLQFVVIPLLWLSLFRLNLYFEFSWLVILGLYIVFLSVCGIMNLPNRSKGGRTQTLLGVLGPIVWGGFLAVFYALLYLVIFEFS